MTRNSPYQGFAFRCNKCQAHRVVNAPRGYPLWNDSLKQMFVIQEFGPSQGELHGKGNQKRAEVDAMLRRMLAGLTHEVDFE